MGLATPPAWVAAVLLLGAWLLFRAAVSSAIPGQAANAAREVAITYVARVEATRQSAGEIQLWVPLAKTRQGQQEVLAREVHAPAPYTVAEDPEFGNGILHLTFHRPVQAPIEGSIDYRVRLVAGGAWRKEDSAEELARALMPNRLVLVDAEIRRRAQQATAGRRTATDRARGIYEHVIQRMTYDKTTPGWGRGDTKRACELGRGNCTDFHSLFISMARAQQIPARFDIGFVIPPEASGTIAGYHCWAEFYDDDAWVPVDASEAWKRPELTGYYFGAHAPNRFLISVGRDLQLVPPQRGEPVNIFLAPYVEVDGQVFEQATAECRFRDLQQPEGA